MSRMPREHSQQELDNLANRLAKASRADLIRMLRRMECEFKLDFNDEFLCSISLQRLRHILMAVTLHGREGAGEFYTGPRAP